MNLLLLFCVIARSYDWNGSHCFFKFFPLGFIRFEVKRAQVFVEVLQLGGSGNQNDPFLPVPSMLNGRGRY